MSGLFNQCRDTLKLLAIGGPAVCNLAVTNVCNARCDFCNYASDKHLVANGLFADYDRYCKTLNLLSRSGVRFLSMVGGEPTLHPQILAMVGDAVQRGIRPSIVTNGSRLTPQFVRALAQSGLKTLFISIDAASSELHEKHRGLPGVCKRIREAVTECRSRNIQTIASVTISKLMGSIPALFTFLRGLGIETVDFSYPKRMLHSPALSFSETSPLIDFTAEELGEILDTIRSFKSRYRILNSRESIAEILRFLRKEEQFYPCLGGYKYFFVDSKLDIYRCDYWPTRMGSADTLEMLPFVRETCTQCISGCYRDASVLMHAGVAFGDALQLVFRGDPAGALRRLARRTNYLSMKSVVREWLTLSKLAGTRFG